MNKLTGQLLWMRWVAANALGEMIGLGLTFAAQALAFTAGGSNPSLALTIGLALLTVIAGTIEGLIVGWAQWIAMRWHFPAITRRAWVLATVVGALVAWFFGSLPSAIMNVGEASAAQGSAQTAAQEPPQVVVLLLAAGLGVVAGAILSFFQYLALRRTHLDHSGWWIPANSLAWMVGMPLIFWGIDFIQGGMNTLQMLLFFAVLLALTGAVVGAIHGIALVRIWRFNPPKSMEDYP
jgi:hypothetical protein